MSSILLLVLFRAAPRASKEYKVSQNKRSFLHLALSALACRSVMQQRSRDRDQPSALMAVAQRMEKDTINIYHPPGHSTTATDSNRRSESASSSYSSSSSTQHQHPSIQVSEF